MDDNYGLYDAGDITQSELFSDYQKMTQYTTGDTFWWPDGIDWPVGCEYVRCGEKVEDFSCADEFIVLQMTNHDLYLNWFNNQDWTQAGIAYWVTNEYHYDVAEIFADFANIDGNTSHPRRKSELWESWDLKEYVVTSPEQAYQNYADEVRSRIEDHGYSEHEENLDQSTWGIRVHNYIDVTVTTEYGYEYTQTHPIPLPDPLAPVWAKDSNGVTLEQFLEYAKDGSVESARSERWDSGDWI
tara:strand:- start:621 stop:1346 length:726 start_codon:yes stop_codon:yes gene_type:complete